MKKIFVVFTILLFPLLSIAQPKVEWNGMLYFYNFFHSNTDFISTTEDGNTYMYIHGDIQANVDFGDGVTAYIMMGAWGQHGMNPYYGGGLGENIDPSARLLQAYLTINNLFDSPISLRIGKERLLYGDGALFFDGGEDGTAGVKLMINTDLVDADMFFYRPGQFGGIAHVGSGNDIYPGNWNVYGIYPTFKLAKNQVRISPYLAIRHVQVDKNSANAPIWYGLRFESNPINEVSLTAEYAKMGRTNDINETDYKGYHLRVGADYTSNNPSIGIGAYYVINSGDDETTPGENEMFESVLNGPYTNGFYKDWPGFGPAHLMTTVYGFSGLAPHNATVVNLNVINGHVSFSSGPFTIRGDYFMYKKDWVPEDVDTAFGNEIALLLKYNYRDNLTIGFTGGVWMPGNYQKNSIEISGSDAKAENAVGGYFWISKSF